MTDTTIDTPARPNKRTAAKLRTAAKVLDAARALFDAVGYEKATIREVAKAAGMSTGAIFANYDDKAQLYLAVYGHAPITPEVGRAAMRLLRALTVDLDGQNGTQEPVDQLAAIDHLRAHAEGLLDSAGFPPLPAGQPNPDEIELVDVMKWAVEAQS